jgi:hypothetical protein
LLVIYTKIITMQGSLEHKVQCGVSQQTMICSILFRQKITAEHYRKLLVFINLASLLEFDE